MSRFRFRTGLLYLTAVAVGFGLAMLYLGAKDPGLDEAVPPAQWLPSQLRAWTLGCEWGIKFAYAYNATPTPTPTPAAMINQVDNWTPLKCWEGTGSKNTESFFIAAPGPWRIGWRAGAGRHAAGILQVFVHDLSNDSADLIVNQMGAANDITYIYATGEFYLSVNSANTDWRICVEY